MIKKIIAKLVIGILAAACLLSVGCSKLTTENYDKLEMGMSYGEVVAILGEADACDGAIGLKKCTWGNEKKHIKVNFAGDKVLVFSAKGL